MNNNFLCHSYLKYILLGLIFYTCSSQGICQNASQKKADILYKAKRYAEAIPLYKEVILENDSKSIYRKLGECYRNTNQNQQALNTYEVLIAKDKLSPKLELIYIELLVLNGQLDMAKEKLSQLEVTEKNLDQYLLLQSNIYNQHKINPIYKNVLLVAFEGNTTEFDENSPFIKDEKLLFSSDRPSLVLKQKSGWTGRSLYKIWQSMVKLDSTFKAFPLGSRVNALNKNCANASLDTEYKRIFFSRNDNRKDKKGFYNMQLYSAKLKEAKSGKSKKLDFCNSQFNYMHPSISSDGTELYFSSDKPGLGGTDIYVCQRKKDGWSKPINLGEAINTSGYEGFPFIRNDKLYFCSKGHSGYGGYDIFVSTRNEDGVWSKPSNLGKPFNSPSDDLSIFFSADSKGAFSSSRNGSDDIYFFQIKD